MDRVMKTLEVPYIVNNFPTFYKTLSLLYSQASPLAVEPTYSPLCPQISATAF